MKKTITTILVCALMMVLSLMPSFAASSTTKQFTSAPDLAALLGEGYNAGAKGPIQIVQGAYRNIGVSGMPVYVVLVAGTEVQPWTSNSYLADVLSGWGSVDNPYFLQCKSTMERVIPSGANVILVGHSLGGMTTQQIACDTDLQARYNIIYNLCFGSPLVMSEGYPEGEFIRLADTNDPVPYLSSGTLLLPQNALLAVEREVGTFSLDLLSAHANSYGNKDIWGKYDVKGAKNGRARLTLDMSTRNFYRAGWVPSAVNLIQKVIS